MHFTSIFHLFKSKKPRRYYSNSIGRNSLLLTLWRFKIKPSVSRMIPCLVRISFLKMAVSVFSCCGSALAVTEEMQSRRGLFCYVSICCTLCGNKSLVTDPYCEEDLAVNSRFILGLRVVGKGRAAMESLTGIMGMLPPLSMPRFSSHTKVIYVASTAEKEDQFSSAVAVLWKHARDDEIIVIQVTCDLSSKFCLLKRKCGGIQG